MKINLIESIEKLGLSKTESTVYFYILKTGVSSTADVSSGTGIKRSTVVDNIDNLLKKNFLSQTIKGRRKLYLAESPKKVLKSYEENKKSFEGNIEELLMMFNLSTDKPHIEFYLGDKSYEPFMKISESNSPLHGFVSPDKLFSNTRKSDNKKFLNNIQERGNVLKDIVPNTEAGEGFVSDVKLESVSSRKAKLAPENLDIPVTMLISGDKVAVMSFDNLMGILIKNKEVADFLISIHKYFWNK